jgi:hypothetical protein
MVGPQHSRSVEAFSQHLPASADRFDEEIKGGILGWRQATVRSMPNVDQRSSLKKKAGEQTRLA